MAAITFRQIRDILVEFDNNELDVPAILFKDNAVSVINAVRCVKSQHNNVQTNTLIFMVNKNDQSDVPQIIRD